MILFSLEDEDFKILLTTLQPPEQELVKEFLQCVRSHAESHGIDSEYSFTNFVDKCNIPKVTLLKEGILSQALWISFLNVMRYHTPADSPLFKYKSDEAFVKEYGEKFALYDTIEVAKLRQTANWLNILFTMVPAKKNKGLSIHVVPKLIEGTKAKYITGSGQTTATADRVFVYEHEGNIVPYQRGTSKKKGADGGTGQAGTTSSATLKDSTKGPGKPAGKKAAPQASTAAPSSTGPGRPLKREREAPARGEGQTGRGRQRKTSPYEEILTHYASRDQTTTMGSCTSGIGMGLGMGLGVQGPVAANSTIDLYKFWATTGENELGPRPLPEQPAGGSTKKSVPTEKPAPIDSLDSKVPRRRGGGGKAGHGGMSGVDFQECLTLLSSSSTNSLASLLSHGRGQLLSAPDQVRSMSPRLDLELPHSISRSSSSSDAVLDSPRVDIEGVDIEAEPPEGSAPAHQVSELNYSTSGSHIKSKLLKKSSFPLRKSSSNASMDLSSTNSLMDLLERHISDDSIQNWSEGAQMTSSVVLQSKHSKGNGNGNGNSSSSGSGNGGTNGGSRTGSAASRGSAESPFISSPFSLASPPAASANNSPRAMTNRRNFARGDALVGAPEGQQALLGPPLLPDYSGASGKPSQKTGGSPGLARGYSWGTLCPSSTEGLSIGSEDSNLDPESSFSHTNMSSSLTAFPLSRQDSTNSMDLAGDDRGSNGSSPHISIRKKPSLPTLKD